MNVPSGLWELLSRDVAFLGGPHSPLLSWLGSGGIVLFFLWKIFKLKKETTTVRRAFERLRPMLIALTDERGDIDRERFLPHPKKRFPTQTDRAGSSSIRIDCEDIQKLNSGMHQEPMFRGLWAQYRMTLILEQVPWFVEPRIFSTRRAEEVFTQEALLTRYVNLSSYRQFPSVVTGLGLLLTFLALFIGLGKLHAEGSEIAGIQGLINGLAGKFLTSIVGLIVANLFTFIEQPMVARLKNAYHTFLGLIDQLFPRKTMEQMLEQLTSLQGDPTKDPSTSSGEIREQRGEWDLRGVAGSTANLTSAVQTLTKLQQAEHVQTRQTMEEIPRVLKTEFRIILRELTEAIHDLTKMLKEQPKSAVAMEASFDDRPLLWKPSTYSGVSPNSNFVERISSWPRRAWMARQRRTG